MAKRTLKDIRRFVNSVNETYKKLGSISKMEFAKRKGVYQITINAKRKNSGIGVPLLTTESSHLAYEAAYQYGWVLAMALETKEEK